MREQNEVSEKGEREKVHGYERLLTDGNFSRVDSSARRERKK